MPGSQCAKNQRNGPCGGTHDGLCEVLRPALHLVRAYDRLKPYGEELTMLDRAPVLGDNALERTSAWANTYLGRDHTGAPPPWRQPRHRSQPTAIPAATTADTSKEPRA